MRTVTRRETTRACGRAVSQTVPTKVIVNALPFRPDDEVVVIVVAAADAEVAMVELKAQGEAVYRIGRIRARQGDEAQTLVV